MRNTSFFAVEKNEYSALFPHMLGDGEAVISSPLYQHELMLGAITLTLTHTSCISSERSS